MPVPGGELCLAVSPFRPGELPLTVLVALDPAAREQVARAALAAGLPAPLWLRIAVEAARLVDEIVALTGRGAGELVAALDAAAATTPRRVGGDLTHYAELLGRWQPAGPVGDRLALRLPEELAARWRRAAGEEHLALPAWVAARVNQAPRGAVAWEAAAARDGRTLGEWAYASALSALASSSA